MQKAKRHAIHQIVESFMEKKGVSLTKVREGRFIVFIFLNSAMMPKSRNKDYQYEGYKYPLFFASLFLQRFYSSDQGDRD